MQISKDLFFNYFEKFFFIFLVIVCFIFILLNGLMLIGANIPTQFSKDLYRINYDHSYGEFFQYFLLLGILIFNIFIFLKERSFLFIIPFTFYLLLDDYFMIHDNVKSFILFNLDYLFHTLNELVPIRLKDIYEFMWHLCITLPLFLISILCFHNKNMLLNKFKIKYFISITLLIFFGLFVDILSVIIVNLIDTPKHPVNFIMTIMEEGGEMIVISFLFSTFIGYFLEQRKT